MKYQIPIYLNKNSGIYLISNCINDRFYIGSAVGFRRRFSNHLSTLKKGIHHNQRLQNFVNKYGVDLLRFTLLSVCNKRELINKEQFFIDTLNPYFNICRTAGNTTGNKNWLGRSHTEETKKRISESNRLTKSFALKPKRICLSKQDSLTRLIAASKTDNSRQSRRERMTGNKYWINRQHTEETKTKMSLNNGRIRPIFVTDSFGITLRFDTGKHASSFLGVTPPAVCNGISRKKKVRGYCLAYKDPNTR